jgi:hypothetical protein
MSKLEAEAIREEAVSKEIKCDVKDLGGVYIVVLGDKHKQWLSYWYAVLDLWELEYRKDGCLI